MRVACLLVVLAAIVLAGCQVPLSSPVTPAPTYTPYPTYTPVPPATAAATPDVSRAPEATATVKEIATATETPTMLSATPTGTPVPPTATPTLVPTDVPPTAVPATSTPMPSPTCIYAMAFVRDVTVPDGTRFEPGASFVKKWEIRNAGTCPWEAGASLTHAGGEPMGSAGPVVLPQVRPNETAQVSVELAAPTEPGGHSGRWQVCAASGCYQGLVTVVIETAGAQPSQPSGSVPVQVLDAVPVSNGDWGQGTIHVEHRNAIYVGGPSGSRFKAQLGFLSLPQSLAAIQDCWTRAGRGGANWTMTLVVRKSVGWISCSDDYAACHEASISSSQAVLTNEIYLRPDVWSSLLHDYLTSGLAGIVGNAHYAAIQESAFAPVCGAPNAPSVGVLFEQVEGPPIAMPPLMAQPGPGPDTVSATPTPQTTISFTADKTTVASGECAVLRWDVEGAIEVFFDGAGTVGHGEKRVCPSETTTYKLRVVRHDGEETRTVKVTVQ